MSKHLDPLLTAKDVKRLLGVSLPLVYLMAERKQLSCVRWDCPGQGGKRKRQTLRFRLTDVIAFIDRHSTNGASD